MPKRIFVLILHLLLIFMFSYVVMVNTALVSSINLFYNSMILRKNCVINQKNIARKVKIIKSPLKSLGISF
jgi:hypothetical protein